MEIVTQNKNVMNLEQPLLEVVQKAMVFAVFVITFELKDNFTTNLKGSKAFLQISVGVSTQYDETVMENVELHQLALRSEILGAVSEFAVEEIEGKTGRDNLSARIKEAINVKLEELEGFGGVEGVFFTSFVLQ